MTLSVNAGSSATAAFIDSAIPITIVKPTDESVTSSSTLQPDNDLFGPLVANATYIFDCYLNYEGGTINASDLKWQWSVPSGAVMKYSAIYEQPSTTLIIQLTNAGSATISAASNGAANLRAATMSGSIAMSTTPGNLQFTWAQVTPSATATIVHAGSYLRIQRST